MTWKQSLSQSWGRSKCRRAGQAGRDLQGHGGGRGGSGRWAGWCGQRAGLGVWKAPPLLPRPSLWQARCGSEAALGPQGKHTLVSEREMQQPGMWCVRPCSVVDMAATMCHQICFQCRPPMGIFLRDGREGRWWNYLCRRQGVPRWCWRWAPGGVFSSVSVCPPCPLPSQRMGIRCQTPEQAALCHPDG